MDEHLPDKKIVDRIRGLQTTRESILRLSPQETLEKILDHPQPAALVHSFPESDLLLLINDLGGEDAMPLLALASGRQWEYFIDVEGWQRDRIDLPSVTRWMSLLLEADPQRFIRWCLTEKLDLVEYYLFKNLEVRILEHDQDPSDFGEGYFSLDNTYFIRFQAPAGTPSTEGIDEKRRRRFLKQLLQEIAGHDHATYQHLLLEATHALPAEAEEDAYRWRNVRLAEKGLLPLEEAIAVYQRLRPDEAEKRPPRKIAGRMDETARMPVPIYPFHELKSDSLFARALQTIEDAELLQQLQAEFAALCNRIVVADQKTMRDRDALGKVVQKANGYISMGMERMLTQTDGPAPLEVSALIEHHFLQDLFRIGFGSVLEVKWRAEKWIADSWFVRRGLRLTFWGEQWLGALGGLLIKRPLYHDNYRTGVLYREFESMQDLADAERIFEQARALDDLFSLMELDLNHPAGFGFLTFKSLLLTLWAGTRVGVATKSLRPLTLDELREFFADLLPGDPDPASDSGRRVPDGMKSDFIHWLARETGLRDFEITGRLGRAFEELFLELESEYGRVAARNLDPRFVHLFLLENTSRPRGDGRPG